MKVTQVRMIASRSVWEELTIGEKVDMMGGGLLSPCFDAGSLLEDWEWTSFDRYFTGVFSPLAKVSPKPESVLRFTVVAFRVIVRLIRGKLVKNECSLLDYFTLFLDFPLKLLVASQRLESLMRLALMEHHLLVL